MSVPYKDSALIDVRVGDCLKSLKKIPEGSVNCVITSPPYYGLRDYGTAEWVGGDPDCDHKPNEILNIHKISNSNEKPEAFYKEVCEKCGAKRVDDQVGLELTPEKYIDKMVEIFAEIKRILTKDGTIWVNIGDSYAGLNSRTSTGRAGMGAPREGVFHKGGENLKRKDLIGIPWLLAFALRDRLGLYLRQDIIWNKPNPMPESVTDRCTKAHEYIFLLSKSERYFFDNDGIKEESTTVNSQGQRGVPNSAKNIGKKYTQEEDLFGKFRMTEGFNQMDTKNNPSNVLVESPKGWDTSSGTGDHGSFHKDGRSQEKKTFYQYEKKNKRSVWTVAPKPYSEAHFAVYPPDLILPCVIAGCPEKVCAECGTPYIMKPKYKYNSDIQKKDPSFGKYGDQETESANRQGMHGKRGEKLIQVRDNLPSQEKLVAFLKDKTDPKILANSTDLKLSKIEHWFRSDDTGFSYPSVEDWQKVREFIDDWSEEFEEIDRGLSEYELKSDAVGSKTLIGHELQQQCKCETTETKRGVVLDPFAGSGTTGIVAACNNRDAILLELNNEYAKLIHKRWNEAGTLFIDLVHNIK